MTEELDVKGFVEQCRRLADERGQSLTEYLSDMQLYIDMARAEIAHKNRARDSARAAISRITQALGEIPTFEDLEEK